jgi:hypothetical protein
LQNLGLTVTRSLSKPKLNNVNAPHGRGKGLAVMITGRDVDAGTIARRYPVGLYSGVEKLASRLAHNQKNAGAHPATATTWRKCATWRICAT